MRILPSGLRRTESTEPARAVHERLDDFGKRTTPDETSDPIVDICEWFELAAAAEAGHYNGTGLLYPYTLKKCKLFVCATALDASARSTLKLALTISTREGDHPGIVVFDDVLIISLPNNFPGSRAEFDTATRTLANHKAIDKGPIGWRFWLDDGPAWFSILKSDWDPKRDTVISAIHEALRWIMVQLIRYKVLKPEGS